MSSFLPDPAAPGSVDPALLAKVTELHATVRQWLDDSATAQKNAHLSVTTPYVDLMFAFGFATLGDSTSATRLAEDARTVLESPIPPQWNPKKDPNPVVLRLVREFLLKAFGYRLDEALHRRPHTGPLSAEVVADLEGIRRIGNLPPVNNPHKLAQYIIDRFREQFRSVEPEEGVDPYALWTKHGDQLKKEMATLETTSDPHQLVARIRKLIQEGIPGRELPETRFYALHQGLPLAVRVGEAFTVELLDLVPAALAEVSGPAGEGPFYPRAQGKLLQRAVFVATHYNRVDHLRKLTAAFFTHIRYKPEEGKYRLISAAAVECIRGLKRLGLLSELDRFLNDLQNEVLRSDSITELREKYVFKRERWRPVLQALLNIAGGWLTIGLHDRAGPILAEARNELLRLDVRSFASNDYTELARAYVGAFGEGPVESGLGLINELFREMPRTRISDAWTTARYYSRSHLNLVEDTVAAVCRQVEDNPPCVIV